MRRRLIDLVKELVRPRPPKQPTGSSSTRDAPAGGEFEYSPCIDGDPDPGEVVWTWVPFEDDPSQGKDRPVVVLGRRRDLLLAVALTSKRHEQEPQVAVGTGPWDREGRVSYAKVDRLLEVVPDEVRREGAVLPRPAFDAVVAGVRHAARG
jgi:hypothetical protein